MNGDLSFFDTVTIHEAPAIGFAFLELLADSPFAVFRNAPALFLCKRSEDGKHQLAIPAHGMNILFLKVYIDTQFFQFTHGIQESQGVTSKSADRFGNDPVDLACPAILKHALEPFTVVLRTRVLSTFMRKIVCKQ